MKKNRTFRRLQERQSRRRTSALALESLEDRHLLAANVLASVDDSITLSSPRDDIEMTVSTPSAAPGDSVTLMIQMTATDAGLDPAAPVIRSSSGAIMTPISSMEDAVGTDGMTVVELAAGDYTVETSAEGGTTGGYTVDVAVLGDVETADSLVSSFERLRASASLLQELGQINQLTHSFFAQRGIDLTVSQYDSGFDANMNGKVDGFEVAIVEGNQTVGRTDVELQSDVDGPTFDSVGLVNDTGISDSDNITTDVRISGRVQDENTITQVSVSVDGGATLDITSDVNPANGFFTLTRAILDDAAGGILTPGSHSVVISGVDEFGNVASSPGMLDFVLIDNNAAPTTTGPFNGMATEDLPFRFDTSGFFADANPGDVLTFSASGLPAWMSILDGFLQGTPGNDDVGEELITVTATDSQGLDVTTNATITITNTPDAPVITPIQDRFTEEEVQFTLDLSLFISDPDVGDELTVSVDQADGVDNAGNPINLQPLPDWLSFDDATLILSGIPAESDVGASFGVFIAAVDQGGLSDSELFQLTVQDVNDPPQLIMEIPDDSVNEDEAYSLDLNAFFSDPDMNELLSFDAELSDGTPLPFWLEVSVDGILAGTPDDADVGVSLEIVARITDRFQETASDTFILTVNNINDVPVVNDATFRILPTAAAGTVVGTVDFSDDDVGDTVTISAIGGDGNFDVDPMTGVITVADGASFVDGEMFTLNVTGTDAAGDSDMAVVTINVRLNDPPMAVDDDGFSTTDIETLEIDASSLLSNDTDPNGDTLTITDVDGSSANGATIAFDQGKIVYNPRLATALLELRPGESLTDTFTYMVSDGTDFDTATVEVQVNGTDSVEFFVRTFDPLTGNEIAVVQPGDEFDLRVFVEDIRPNPQGVFAPFVDVTYEAELASVPATDPPGDEIVPSSTYNTVPEGDASTPGLLDEVGGLGALSPLGEGEFEVFSVRMQAGNTPGVINFASDAADEPNLHVVLVYLDDDPVPTQQILYGATTLTIAGPIPPLSGNVPGSNFANPMDTNDDSFVSAMDALVVVNAMETGSSSLYPDVNADGLVSPMDALMVVNHLSGGTPQAPLSGSESATESAIDSIGSVSMPTLESGSGAVLSAGNVPGVPDATPSSADESGLAVWSAPESSEVAVGDHADDATRLIDAIFAELG